MKLKFEFMKKNKILLYQVVSQLFMASGDTVLFQSVNKQAAERVCRRYDSMPGDPYESISIREVRALGYIETKKL